MVCEENGLHAAVKRLKHGLAAVPTQVSGLPAL